MSAKVKDLTGKRFGRLTVIRDTGKRTTGNSTKYLGVIWECVCDCGKHTEVFAGNLGKCTRSCGCLNSEMARERSKENLTGQRFGRLVVIKESQKRTKRSIYWDCICDCGNYKAVQPRHLKSGRIASCGCLQKQLGAEKIKRTIEHNRKNVFVEKTSLNALTSKVPSDNTSGVKGVRPVKKSGKWKAYITINKKNITLGIFTEKEDAIAARKKAEEKYHKPILEKYGITAQNK